MGPNKPAFFRQPLVTLLMVLLASLGLRAQQDRTGGGYYIDTAGEQIRGYFPKGINLSNLSGFLFSEEPGEAPERIRLDSVREIYLSEGEQYLVYEEQVGNISELITLRKLVEGQSQLFGGSSSLRGGTVFLLRERGGRDLLIHRQNAAGVFRLLARDCPDLETDEIAYRQREVIDLALALNACEGVPAAVLVEPAAPDFRIGLRPYAYWPNLHVPASNFYGLGEYTADMGFSLAASLAWVVNSRLRVLLEVSYLHLTSSSSYVNVMPRDVPETFAEVTFDMQYLETPLLVQYSWPLQSLRPFVEAGLYAGIPLRRELEQALTFADASHNQFTPTTSFSEVNFGYTLGVGAGYAFAPRWEAGLLIRWTQASSQMRTERTGNAAPILGFTNLRTDKLSVGLRMEYRL